MAKLFFRYGTMGSGKSLDLLKVAYNYEENGLTSIILTSKIDDRYGNDKVQSRTGIKREAIGIDSETNIFEIIEYKKNIIGNNIGCILVDEVQFFKTHHIEELVNIVDIFNIPVICYGLRTDFTLNPFEPIKYLMGVADEIEEIKTICSECTKKKAIVNARFDENGKIVTTGNIIEIGGNDKYRALCRKCYNKKKS